jgi:hypothetical protein
MFPSSVWKIDDPSEQRLTIQLINEIYLPVLRILSTIILLEKLPTKCTQISATPL